MFMKKRCVILLKSAVSMQRVLTKEIPVVLAGGISTKEAADHAFSLGADAIQAATRFVTTYECDASGCF